MAKIYLDNHEIDTLVLTPATGSPVTKSLTAENSYDSGDEGKVVKNGALAAQESATYTSNGTYDTTTKNSVTVNVSGGGTPSGTKEISITANGTTTENVSGYASAEITVNVPTGTTPTGTKQIGANGTYDVTDFASAEISVPNSYAAGDEGKVVSSGALVAQSSQTVTENGTYDTTLKNSVTVNVPSASVDGWDIYSKELVETWGATVNLKDDTNFDELTPSTGASTIQLKNGADKSVSVDFANYAYIMRREEYIKAAYTGTPGDKAFCDQSSVAVWFFYRGIGGLLTARLNAVTDLRTYGVCHRQYDSNGDPVMAQNGASYGIYPSPVEAPTFSSSSATSTTLTIKQPKWSMRGSASYSPVETLEAIDSANSSIEYRYLLYRIPKATLMMTAADECEYITTNGHLRSLST